MVPATISWRASLATICSSSINSDPIRGLIRLSHQRPDMRCTSACAPLAGWPAAGCNAARAVLLTRIWRHTRHTIMKGIRFCCCCCCFIHPDFVEYYVTLSFIQLWESHLLKAGVRELLSSLTPAISTRKKPLNFNFKVILCAHILSAMCFSPIGRVVVKFMLPLFSVWGRLLWFHSQLQPLGLDQQSLTGVSLFSDHSFRISGGVWLQIEA